MNKEIIFLSHGFIVLIYILIAAITSAPLILIFFLGAIHLFTVFNYEYFSIPISREIGFLKGARISADIKNNGATIGQDVEWSITISGGIIGRINVVDQGVIDTIESEETKTVNTTSKIFGFGKVEIKVIAEGVVETIDGFILGSLIILKQ